MRLAQIHFSKLDTKYYKVLLLRTFVSKNANHILNTLPYNIGRVC